MMTHVLHDVPTGALFITGGEMRHYRLMADSGLYLDKPELLRERPELTALRPISKPPIPAGFIVAYVNFHPVAYAGPSCPTPRTLAHIFTWKNNTFVTTSEALAVLQHGSEEHLPVALAASSATLRRKMREASPLLKFTRDSALTVDTLFALKVLGAVAKKAPCATLIGTDQIDALCDHIYDLRWEVSDTKKSLAQAISANDADASACC